MTVERISLNSQLKTAEPENSGALWAVNCMCTTIGLSLRRRRTPGSGG